MGLDRQSHALVFSDRLCCLKERCGGLKGILAGFFRFLLHPRLNHDYSCINLSGKPDQTTDLRQVLFNFRLFPRTEVAAQGGVYSSGFEPKSPECSD